MEARLYWFFDEFKQDVDVMWKAGYRVSNFQSSVTAGDFCIVAVFEPRIPRETESRFRD